MKVWVARRRQWGMLIPDCLARATGITADPCELLVMTVSDQGSHKPVRVARLYGPHGGTPLAELLLPRLIHMRDNHFVLTGTERCKDTRGHYMGFAQSWLCELAPPYNTAPLEVSDMYRGGVAVTRAQRSAGQITPRSGQLVMTLHHDEELGRVTPRTLLVRADGSTDSRSLLDTSFEWANGHRFVLSGYQRNPGTAGKPSVLLEQAWLCAFRLPQELDPTLLDKHGEPLRECR